MTSKCQMEIIFAIFYSLQTKYIRKGREGRRREGGENKKYLDFSKMLLSFRFYTHNLALNSASCLNSYI